MKVSIIIPVYFNEDNLNPLYEDIKEKFIDKIDYDYEIVMVNDGSEDKSWEVMNQLAIKDKNIKIYSLSRNFGSHAAMLCGLEHCTGDCAIIKCADLQEPTEIIIDMVNKWKSGDNVVLAVREDREEGFFQTLCANTYYKMVQKLALSKMPDGGFDVYLLDRKVINVLTALDEKNSALTGQVLWSGFKTGKIYYTRKAREIGKSRWTLKKKIRLVSDSLYSFSTVPITVVSTLGVIAFGMSLIWAIIEVLLKLTGQIDIQGWTLLFIFVLFSFGVQMLTLGIIGNYLWRTFDATRNRPVYIVEKEGLDNEQ